MMQLPEETFEMDSIRKLCSFPLLSDTYPTEETRKEQSRWDQRRRRRTSRWKEGQNKTKLDIRSKEDEGGIQVDKQQDKVTDAAGLGGPIFGAGKDDKKQDLGVTGTG
ncbi:hypothetical protein Bca101_045072 [Brassica carinata]